MIVESKTQNTQSQQPSTPDFSREPVEPNPEFLESLQENKRKIEESMGSQFKGILDTTAPLSRGGSMGDPKASGPLANFAPDDPGVDISGLMAMGAGKNWKHLI